MSNYDFPDLGTSGGIPTFEKMIIYRPVHNFWRRGPISITFPQMMPYAKLFNHTQCDENLNVQSYFTDQNQNLRSSLQFITKRHRYLKFCLNVSWKIDILWVKFHYEIISSFWFIKVFLIVGLLGDFQLPAN